VSFGQAGLVAGQEGQGAGFVDRLFDLGRQALDAFTRPVPGLPAGVTTAGLIPTSVIRQIPGIVGGLVGGELIESLVGGNGGGMPTLFKQSMTPSGGVRNNPINELTVVGPDGKCHTWLHAVPKGWRVNKANVSGRRRHHHHPR